MADTFPLWFLSFVDPKVAAIIPQAEQVPGGPSWLGSAIVHGADEFDAINSAWRLGCNPGGEVQVVGPVPPDAVKPDYVGRLLTTVTDVEAAAA